MSINLEEYDFVKELGKGGFGTVDLVQNINTKKLYALKTVKTQGISEATKEDLKTEVKICGTIEHRNIVKCYGSLSYDGDIHFLLEYANGGDLLEKIFRNKGLSEAETKKVIIDILNALEYCHSKHICHHDLKPENILIFEDEKQTTYKLADWGIADISNIQINKIKGTLPYSAPEIYDIKSEGHYCDKTDMWAVGVIAFVCMENRYPFSGDDIPSAVKSMENSSPKYIRTPENMQKFINQLLAVNPNKRLTAKEALKDNWILGIETEYYISNGIYTLFNSQAKNIDAFPKNIDSISITKCKIVSLPPLPKIKILSLIGNTDLEYLPDLPDTLVKLNCKGCKNLRKIPKLPSSLKLLDVTECSSLTYLPDLSKSLEDLICTLCVKLEKLPSLPVSLITLTCNTCNFKYLPELPPKLELLEVNKCKNLIKIPKLPKSLIELKCDYCENLEEIEGGVSKSIDFSCDDCDKLKNN